MVRFIVPNVWCTLWMCGFTFLIKISGRWWLVLLYIRTTRTGCMSWFGNLSCWRGAADIFLTDNIDHNTASVTRLQQAVFLNHCNNMYKTFKPLSDITSIFWQQMSAPLGRGGLFPETSKAGLCMQSTTRRQDVLIKEILFKLDVTSWSNNKEGGKTCYGHW